MLRRPNVKEQRETGWLLEGKSRAEGGFKDESELTVFPQLRGESWCTGERENHCSCRGRQDGWGRGLEVQTSCQGLRWESWGPAFS